MTTLDSRTAHSNAAVAAPQGRRKTVLFCPACGHESPLTGDWTVDFDGTTDTYRCPDCQTVVSSRTN
jgi:predicted RNA-binding Zn-ribbon protein involved in translation (DUF1610 family)